MISYLISYHRVFIAWKKEKKQPVPQVCQSYMIFVFYCAPSPSPVVFVNSCISYFVSYEFAILFLRTSRYFDQLLQLLFLHQELSGKQFFKTSLSKDKDIYKTRWGWQDLTERLGKNFALPRKKTRLRWKIAFQNVGRLKAKLSNGGKPNRAELIYKP